MYKIKDFSKDIINIADRNSEKNRSLELYLRALWSIAIKRQGQTLFPKIIMQMLEDAFVVKPADFEETWLHLMKMPKWNFKDEMYVIESFEDGKLVILERNVDDFEIFRRAIQFQIADLSRFESVVFSDPDSYFGVDSPTGNRWFNLTVFQYLHCAASFLIDISQGGDVLYEKDDWVGLAWLLRAGMSYE